MDLIEEFRNNLDFYFSRRLRIPLAKPHWVYISLSHACTYKCQMCGVVNILQGHSLATEKVKEIIDTIASWSTKPVITITGGEPFLRQDIFEIISYAESKGVLIEMVSNGSLIDLPLARRIIVSGLNNIAVSLDGATAPTHDRIRQPGSFEAAIKALSYLVKAKQESARGPQISVWTTIMKENVRELTDLIPLVKNIGIDCLVYHPVIVAQDDMQNTSEKAPFWIRGNDREILKSQIDQLVNYKNQQGFIAFLHDPYLWLDYFSGKLTKKQWQCNPFVFINIGPDAEVRSCGSSFGNVKKIGLDQCLETVDADKARLVMEQCQKPCLQTCWAHPDSDSLKQLISDFVKKVQVSDVSDKLPVFKKGLQVFNEYENLLNQYART
jgi:MoaA/NifB/PqqE/SkfB family radical SAM enzyme